MATLKETENEGKNCRIRVDGIVGTDYVLCVMHIKWCLLELRDFTTSLATFIDNSEKFCPRQGNLLILMNAFEAGLPYFRNVIPIIRASFGMISGSRFGSTHFVVESTTPGIHFFSSYDSSYYVLTWCNLACISRAFRHRGFASSLVLHSNEFCPRFGKVLYSDECIWKPGRPIPLMQYQSFGHSSLNWYICVDRVCRWDCANFMR